MHKITKGLKKKKKGKKSKQKDEELFKPEELEAYRREHQGSTAESGAKNEEWNKFLSLTSGVDDILKKTQSDLDRIKSTSFFQRVPPPSELKKNEPQYQKEPLQEQPVVKPVKEEAAVGIVEVSESEEEDEEDDDIFDTAYIDAIAAGEVKLAYIPESPTENTVGDDPFDTSIAERAILGPAVATKGKRLVPLGSAVEVLTGRVQLPTCATKSVISNKRQILQQQDLLLGSFESNTTPYTASKQEVSLSDPFVVKKSLLDDDEIPLPHEPIDLNKPIVIPESQKVEPVQCSTDKFISNLVEDKDDDEFGLLAAESLSKSVKTITQLPPTVTTIAQDDIEWKPFENINEIGGASDVETDDPFDTTFAENILPGKAELKVIEAEFLNSDTEPVTQVFKSTIPQNDNKDLFNTPEILNNQEQSVPEEQLLGDLITSSEKDFSVSAVKTRTLSRPDVLNVGPPKTVSFELPSPEKDLLCTSEDHSKIAKPLTPFYVRKNSVPIAASPEENIDPFDTSFVSGIAPGKAELKLIENELFDPSIEKNLSLNDPTFDPRDEKQSEVVRFVQTIKEISIDKPEKKTLEPLDLLGLDENIGAKVLTPAADTKNFDELSYSDPFDTSIACNILPGKTELKLLENELLNSYSADFNSHITENQDDFDPFDTSVSLSVRQGKA